MRTFKKMKKEYLIKNPTETQKLGKKLAQQILNKPPSKIAQIIGLKGELGAGKTTFLKGLASGLRVKEKILSPTFVIMKKFKIPDLKRQLVHIDCYRIKEKKQILDLGFQEIISDSKNIVTIEWAEKIEDILPKETIFINFQFVDRNKRKISINF